ncbi:MAG: aryl-sulfate sulfotransferase [Myxococcota bacterium]
MTAWIRVLGLVGCTPGDTPRFRGGGPELAVPDVGGLPLARVLTAELDRPAALVVAIDDARGPRTLTFPVSERHSVPLVGFLPGDLVDLTLTAVVEGAGRSDPVSLSFRAGELPDPFPVFDVLTHDAARAAPGLLLFPVDQGGDGGGAATSRLVALDEGSRVVWTWAPPIQFGDVRLIDGALVGVAEGTAWKVDLAGRAEVEWGAWRDDRLHPAQWRRVDALAMNHELFPLADGGFLTLSPQTRTVPDYPCSYDAPTAPCGDAAIEDPHLIEFDAGGDLVRDWSIASALSPTRIGFDSLTTQADGDADWGHANAVVDLSGGGVLVSVRHQDALVAFDPDGSIRWILGDPAGWPPSFDGLLLEPLGARWPYHMHGPSFDPDGTLWVFDNGNYGHTPYGPATGAPERSRVVGYTVDAQAGTVTESAVRSLTTTGELFSSALGNAAALGETGDVLGVYGRLEAEGSTENTALGWGAEAARLVEWDADGEVVRDVRVRSDWVDGPSGWRVYRASHAPSLYAPGIEAWDDAPQ